MSMIPVRALTRLGLSLTIACGLGWLVTPPLADPGRNYPRCIHLVNQIRAQCDDECVINCTMNVPGGVELNTLCYKSCRSACVDFEQELKQVCRDDTVPSSPTEP